MCAFFTYFLFFFFFKQKTAYEMRISDWSSDVCSSDLRSCHPLDSAGVIAVLGAVSAAIDGLSTCRRPLSRQLQPVEHAAFGFVALAAIGRRRWPEAVEHAPPPRQIGRAHV